MTEQNDGQNAAMFPGTFSAQLHKLSLGIWKGMGQMPGMKAKSIAEMTRNVKKLGRIQEGPVEQPDSISYIINQNGRISRIVYTPAKSK